MVVNGKKSDAHLGPRGKPKPSTLSIGSETGACYYESHHSHLLSAVVRGMFGPGNLDFLGSFGFRRFRVLGLEVLV